MPLDQSTTPDVPVAPSHGTDAPSRIVAAELFELDIPFNDGSVGSAALPGRWSRFDILLVRVTTADSISGWGECFAYDCRAAVAQAFRTMVAPLLIGQDAEEIEALMRQVQHKLHIFGRYGITMFAISGADMALWDRHAKAAGQPLAALLGARRRDVVAYASLVHYGDAPLVRQVTRQAVQEG
jgi:L-alanine-DL-glutamate epimerase-like enolase superfamily enzyme